jgi:hypothetical protein
LSATFLSHFTSLDKYHRWQIKLITKNIWALYPAKPVVHSTQLYEEPPVLLQMSSPEEYVMIKKLSNLILNRSFLTATALVLTLTACSSQPTVRSDQAPDVNLNQYKTFSFVEELATDRAGYTTLVTQHFKDAIVAELTARGYRLVETDPQLLVNFNSNVANRSETRSVPTTSYHYGYYHYRRGIVYAGFPVYNSDISTVHYKVGTVNIDLVDAAERRLVWEGVAEGTLKNKDLEQPRDATARTVALIFERLPLNRN